ncbi:MAG: hypothetical protein R3B70_47665 [Polyangiaceae bacterium]
MIAPILSVDTAYEPDLVLFARGRTDLYREVGAQFAVTQLGQTAADRSRVLRTLARGDASATPYRAVVVSSHGEPSRVLDDDSPDGVLLSNDMPEADLARWAKGPNMPRSLYFCCCYTAQGPLFDRLRKLGAQTVIGFVGQPAWSSTEGQRLWRDLDLEIVRSILHDQRAPAIARVRDHFVDRIDRSLASASAAYKADLVKTKTTLETMLIQG